MLQGCALDQGDSRTSRRQRTRDLTAQIHSIKKTPTEAGDARFDTEKNERHLADEFWVLALAVHAAAPGKEHRRARQKVLRTCGGVEDSS